MVNIQNLTETSIERFALFIKFLSENNLIDDAVKHLKEKGYTDIQISVEPIKEIQKMLEHKLEQGDSALSLRSEETKKVIMSGHANGICQPH